LEQSAGEKADGKCRDTVSSIGQLFGSTENKNGKQITGKGNASRMIVRDAYLNRDSVDEMNNSEFMDLPYSEIKFENTINRILGKADNPRQQERVPAGAIFDVELIVNIFENDNQEELLYTLKKGIQLLTIILGVLLKNIEILIYGFLLVSIVGYVLNYIVSRKIISSSGFREIKTIIMIILIFVFIVALYWFAQSKFNLSLLGTIAYLPFILIAYLILISFAGINIKNYIKFVKN